MSLNRFWPTLEELIGCQDSRHGWSTALAGGFDQVSFLLRSIGTLAPTVRCPSPGGEFCPRHVGSNGDGSFVAVCGNRPAECSDLKLSLDDVRIFALDPERLAGDLASALSLRAGYAPAVNVRQTWRLGYCDVAAGAAFPVYLTIQETSESYIAAIASMRGSHDGSLAVLVPTRRFLGDRVSAFIDKKPIDLVVLPEVVAAGSPDGLVSSAVPAIAFPRAWARTMPKEGVGESERIWVLPSDAKWGELVLEFLAPEVLAAHFRGETRRCEPIDLGMRNKKTLRGNSQWTLLASFAVKGGVIGRNAEDFRRVQSQKQQLSGRLQCSFGIPGDPIVWDADQHEYKTLFVIRGDARRCGI